MIRSTVTFLRRCSERLPPWAAGRLRLLGPNLEIARSAVLTFYRSLMRRPLYAALNLLGLASGIAVLIILSLFVRFETGYDRWLPHAATLYVATVRTSGDTAARRAPAYAGAAHILDVVHAVAPSVTGTRAAGVTMSVRHGDQWLTEAGERVDGDFFKVFAFRFAAGDPQTALTGADAVVISERVARRYFGGTDGVGRYLDIRDGGTAGRWRVTGILRDVPGNSDLRMDLVRRMSPDAAEWSHAGLRQTFVVLRDDAQAKALNGRLDSAMADYARSHAPVEGARPGDSVRFGAIWRQHLADPKRDQAVTALDLTGVLVFLVALVNYVNLATARAGLRAREVAMRKVLGANIQGLRAQFLVEGLLLSAGALVLGFSFVELMLPVVNSVGHLALAVDYGRDAPVLFGLSLGVLACGLLAGTYPAVVLSEFQPTHILSATNSPSAEHYGRWLREGLSALQFAAASAFFIVVIGFAAQIHHLDRARPESAVEAPAPATSYAVPDARDETAAPRRDVRLFMMGGGIAGLIAAVGLFGMAAFSTSMRAHEIGIRKSFGASRWRILRLLVFQFLRPVVAGNGLAWPIAWWVLSRWLSQFPDRIAISPLFFVAGTVVSLCLAVTSVAGIAWSTAAAVPGRALRQD